MEILLALAAARLVRLRRVLRVRCARAASEKAGQAHRARILHTQLAGEGGLFGWRASPNALVTLPVAPNSLTSPAPSHYDSPRWESGPSYRSRRSTACASCG